MILIKHLRSRLEAASGGRKGLRWVTRFARWLLVMLLVLGMAAPEKAAAVEAAPPGTIFIVPATFHMSLRVEETLCAGYNYPVQVAIRADFQRTLGGITVQFSDLAIPGITIESRSADTSVGTLTPDRSVSGALQNDLLPTPSFGSSSAGLGVVTFTFHALKAGVTTLQFQGSVPGSFTMGDPATVGVGQGVRVDNCTYKVSSNGRWTVSYPNLTTTLTQITKGKIVKDNSSGMWNGIGNVTWSLRSFSVMCPHSHSLTLDQVNMEGQGSLDSIAVTLRFGSVGFSTVNCGSSNQGSFQPPIIVGGGPASGFSVSGGFPFQVGNEVMNGTWTINVTPVKGR